MGLGTNFDFSFRVESACDVKDGQWFFKEIEDLQGTARVLMRGEMVDFFKFASRIDPDFLKYIPREGAFDGQIIFLDDLDLNVG